MSKFLVLILTINLFFYNLHSLTPESDLNLANFHLKWIFDGYLFPIQLEKKTQPSTAHSDYKWFKYSEKVFLDELSDQAQEYFISKTQPFSTSFDV